MWQPMLPVLVNKAVEHRDWIYEVKYDGFRCGLEWKQSGVKLWSRNNHDLTSQFPEIVTWCKENEPYVKDFLPLFLDGELVILRTPYQAIFSQVQQRSRMKDKKKITTASAERPANFICFDLLYSRGKSIIKKTLEERKQLLREVFKNFSEDADTLSNRLSLITFYQSLEEIQQIIFLHQCEGMVSKQKHSRYVYGKRTENWQKVKNYRIIQGVITGYNSENDYFDTAIYHNGKWIKLGKIKNGIKSEERKTLTSFIHQNGTKIGKNTWHINPSICVNINCLDAENQELREPNFGGFRFDLEPEECTYKQLELQLVQLPEAFEITKPDKLLFPDKSKRDIIIYYRQVAAFILPRLQDKHLTTIRYPDGIEEESFYQKHLPNHAPEYIESNNNHLLCNNLESLLWFANHAAIEFHVPFHRMDRNYPDEIVFDLDPPSLDEFPLAVLAAKLIKDLLTYKGFPSFVKTSGRTGLQVHAPIHNEPLSFNQTRELMEAIANVLVEKYPDSFTTERLIKNRGKRLYLDYVQHAPKKTIIAPYSTRATKEATVATPLFWEELDENLDPRIFTIDTVPERLMDKGCPLLADGWMKT
ncbi:DNA ligase D [Gracilibacillus xinjiangensis]|uniref:DNA ligase (ATP) n=1 Tax=Gracilibacillus xinjiangensis TaxID=1193282 RepID=A0ABV8WYQ1_9BACI